MFTLFRKIFKSERVLVLAILLLTNASVYWQFYLKGLLPFPGDLLVAFFFPWNSGGFSGFDPWTIHKEVIAADVIRQMYPWKVFAFDLIRLGQIPLWNPYNFSGYPLIANLQSSIFFPGNVLFLIFPPLDAWILLVIGLPFLLSLFSYLFFRSLRLSLISSLFGAIIMANLSYLVVWHEQLIITQVAVLLPLFLFFANRYKDTNKKLYFWLLPLILSSAIYAGHAQTFIYLLIISVSFVWFKRYTLQSILFVVLISFLLGAAQLLPTMEIYLQSAREGEATRRLFEPFILSWSHLLTIVAPDFFGNPATNNYWGEHYGDFQCFFGVVALVFSLLAIWNCHKEKLVKLFTVLALLGLLFAIRPFAYLPHILHIPILATGVPARVIYIFQLSMAVLAVFGLDYVIRNKDKLRAINLLPILFLGIVYASLWSIVLINKNTHFAIARSNLVLPTFTFLATSGVIFFLGQFKKISPWLLATSYLLLFSLALFEYSYFFNKYQPFSPKKYVFPSHPVFSFLQRNAGINRFFGFGTAYVDSNFATHYKVFAPEGWDSLYIKRYGELLASTKEGKYTKDILRSDALFGREDNQFRNRLFDLMGVRFVLDKNDQPKTNWEPETSKFSEEKYQLVWQSYKWKVYERKMALPRFFLADGYEVIKDDSQIISRLYDPTFDMAHKVILENDPKVALTPGYAYAQLISYTPNNILLETQSSGAKLIFLSDSYFPGWHSYIDGKESQVLRADFAFRAVAVPPGKHQITFVYDPLSFKLGLLVTASSGLLLLTLALYKKFKI